MYTNTFFICQLGRGAQGEELVREILQQRGWEVVDVRNSENYRRQDVDFRVHRGQDHLSVEVKTDGYIAYTGNFPVENLSSTNVRHKGLGWYHYTTADSLIYVCENTQAVYAFRMDEIRSYLNEGGKYEVKCSTFPNGTTENWLINMDDYTNAGYEIQILN